MGLLDSLLKAEQKIQNRIDLAFGKGAARTPLEMRRDILEEVENHVVIRKGKRIFPFTRLAVHLWAPEPDIREVLAATFREEDALAGDIRQLLRESGCETAGKVEVVVDFEAGAEGGSAAPRRFRLEFIRPEERERPPVHAPGRMPAAQLVVVKGVAEQAVFRMDKGRIQIGRLRELLDKDGQIVRRNDLVFLDNGEEINSTVGRAHAKIWFVPERGEFRISDEMSRYGTRIFRDGHPIEVAGGNPRGVRLLPGDEIYLGHACLRFELA
jgi:hypothetical protein